MSNPQNSLPKGEMPSSVDKGIATTGASAPLLQVRDLATEFATRSGIARAVDGVSFDVFAGEIVGLVGESGSGKSVTGYSILGLIDLPGRITGGSVRLEGQELSACHASNCGRFADDALPWSFRTR
jgi:ABC-type glutathione transport system ATPase component